MTRQVRGLIFVDYVRSLRRFSAGAAFERLTLEDLQYLSVRIEPWSWYPMATFERFGDVILAHIIAGDYDLARVWGQQQIREVVKLLPLAVAEGEPRDTLMQFNVMARELFDYAAVTIEGVDDESAHVVLAFGMGPNAEHAASMQAMGFFEALLELSGARGVAAHFASRSWEGAPQTMLALTWEHPNGVPRGR